MGDGARPPSGVGEAQRDDPCLDLWGHLMRTASRPRGLARKAGDALTCVAAQPAMHGLARHPVAAGDLADALPAENLEHGLVDAVA